MTRLNLQEVFLIILLNFFLQLFPLCSHPRSSYAFHILRDGSTRPSTIRWISNNINHDMHSEAKELWNLIWG
jgi:hypothetical protein